jgi:hypothetical protein
MYPFDLQTVDKVVYQRENSSVPAKISHGKLAKIQSRPTGTLPVGNLLQALLCFN